MPLYTYDDGATYNEGDTYNGDLLNGVRHGQGTYTWANGDTYVGPFDQYGYMSGEGIKTYANGDVYKGEVYYSYATGEGTRTYSNGDVQVGIFKHDVLAAGQGTKTYKNGDVYNGEFIDGYAAGQGTKTYKNGDVYTGSFGEGWSYTQSGIIETRMGVPSGEGTKTWANGYTFTGEFLDGFAKSSGGVVEGKIPYFLDTATVDKPRTSINTTDAVLQDKPKAWVSNKTYDNGTSTTITYSFSGTSDLYLFAEGYFDPNPKIDTVSAFSVSQQEAFRLALKQFSDIADITFVEVEETAAEVGTIRIGFVSSQYEDTWGWASSPGSDRFGDYSPRGGDIWVEDSNKDGTFIRGRDYNFGSLMHEIGHALGLAHPHVGEHKLPVNQDYSNYTLMSYENLDNASYYDSNGNFIYLISSTPMVYDIAAVQHLYGAASHNTADTVYKYDPSKPVVEAIWDSGGIDTLDFSNFGKALDINLTPGAYSTIAFNSWSMTDNLGIAAGAIIEKAIAGSGNDIITGNSSDNTLYGGAGNDVISAGDGNDIIYCGTGNDTLTGGLGADEFRFYLGDGSNTITDFSRLNDVCSFYQLSGEKIAAESITQGKNAANEVKYSLADGTSVYLAGVFENSSPTGAVTISGLSIEANDAEQGDILKAEIALLEDKDGLGVFSYQWLRDGDDINLATSKNYTLIKEDVGSKISVSVSFLDGAETNETVTSLETASIIAPKTFLISSAVVIRDGSKIADADVVMSDGTNSSSYKSAADGSVSGVLPSGSASTVTGSLAYSNSIKAISSQDALDALKLSVGMTTAAGTKTAFDFISADFNQDGKLSSQDALSILKYSVGLTTPEQAKWVFVDTNGDYTSVSKSNTSYTEGVSIAELSADTTVSLTGILIGDVNDSYSGLIA